jgi:pyruvate kinase
VEEEVSDLRHTRPLTQVEVEERIATVIEAMETHTEDYDDLARRAAEAEADYRRQSATALLAVIQHSDKMTVGERGARADLMCAAEHKEYLIATAARNSKREYLLTLRAHLDALRTLNASIRGQT